MNYTTQEQIGISYLEHSRYLYLHFPSHRQHEQVKKLSREVCSLCITCVQMVHHLHSDYKLPSLLTESTTSLGTKWLQYELS